MARVTATMIVKDEELVLPACLASLAGCVDEIVLVDTGSSDKTRDIARRSGARLFDVAWTDDFAAARNAALERATGEWILYIDADERLEVPDGMALANLLEDPGAAAATVIFQPRLGFTSYKEMRLFRNDPRIRFAGVMHETIVTSIHDVCRSDGLAIRDSAIRIVHVGYEGDLARKHHRNLPLLRKAVIERPDNAYCWQHLGETLAALGHVGEAVEACRKAVAIAAKNARGSKQRVDGSLAYQTLVRVLASRNENPLPVIEEGLQSFPDDCALAFMRAWALVGASRDSEALEILDRLIAEDPQSFHDPLIAYDVRIFGEFAHDLRGAALLHLGRPAEAAAAFEGAAAAAPDNMAYRAKAIAARGHASRIAGAIT